VTKLLKRGDILARIQKAVGHPLILVISDGVADMSLHPVPIPDNATDAEQIAIAEQLATQKRAAADYEDLCARLKDRGVDVYRGGADERVVKSAIADWLSQNRTTPAPPELEAPVTPPALAPPTAQPPPPPPSAIVGATRGRGKRRGEGVRARVAREMRGMIEAGRGPELSELTGEELRVRFRCSRTVAREERGKILCG
jgi:hypothetical protein